MNGVIMENRNIIIILAVIALILAVIAGAMFMQSGYGKEASKIKIVSDKSQDVGGTLKIQLTDLNKTALSKENLNVIVVNKKGKVVVNETVKTDMKGKAKLYLDLKNGTYSVNVTYGGNDNYTGNSTSQKLTLKDKQTKMVDEADFSNYPKYNPSIGHYRSTGIGQDEMGVLELSNGQYIVVAGDGYYEYLGQDSQGNIMTGKELNY